MKHLTDKDTKTEAEHEYYMTQALKEAEKAAQMGEIPVGAIITYKSEIIAKSYNLKESKPSALAHAELLAIEQATAKLNRWRLDGCCLYVTLEPCVMCAGALVSARLDTLVYGATDKKAGAVSSVFNLLTGEDLNHRVEVISGILKEPCSLILKEFFSKLRKQKQKP